MQTLPPEDLAERLRDSSQGDYGTEAAAELLIAHDVWLHRSDFIDACVWTLPISEVRDVEDDRDGVLYAGIVWSVVADFADIAACSGSEARILRLVAELAGHDTGIPLKELLSGLDDRNSALVLDAIAHTLNTQLWTTSEGQS